MVYYTGLQLAKMWRKEIILNLRDFITLVKIFNANIFQILQNDF